MRRAAWLLLLALWCVAVVVAFSLIAGCSRDALPVPGDMSAARDAEPLGDCTLIGWHLECRDFGAPACGDLLMSLCQNDLDCTCNRVCLHAGCGIPGRCIDPYSFDGGVCGHYLGRCCNYPDEPHTFICRDGQTCVDGTCKGCK